MLVGAFLRDMARVPWGTAPLVDLLAERLAVVADGFVDGYLVHPVTGEVPRDALFEREMSRSEEPLWVLILETCAQGSGKHAHRAKELVAEIARLEPQDTVGSRGHDYFEDTKLAALRALLRLPRQASPEDVMRLAIHAFPTRSAELIRQALYEGDKDPAAPIAIAGVVRRPRLRDVVDRGAGTLLALAAEVRASGASWTRFERSLRVWERSNRGIRSADRSFGRHWRLIGALPAEVIGLALVTGLLKLDTVPKDPIWLPVHGRRLTASAELLDDGVEKELLRIGVVSGQVLSRLAERALAETGMLPRVPDDLGTEVTGTTYFLGIHQNVQTRVLTQLFGLIATKEELALQFASMTVPSTKQASLSWPRPDLEALAQAIVNKLSRQASRVSDEATSMGEFGAIQKVANRLAGSSVVPSKPSRDVTADVESAVILAEALAAALEGAAAATLPSAKAAVEDVRAAIEAVCKSASLRFTSKRDVESVNQARLRLLAIWSRVARTLVTSPEALPELGPALHWRLPVSVAELDVSSPPEEIGSMGSLRYFGPAGDQLARRRVRSGKADLRSAITSFPRVAATLMVREPAIRQPARQILEADPIILADFLSALPDALSDRPKVAACLEIALRSDIGILPNLLELAEDIDSGSRHTFGSQLARHYQTYWRPKRSGGKRLVAVPSASLMYVQRRMLATLFSTVEMHGAAHGFVKGRDIVSNAQRHTGKDLVVNVDIRSFFGSTRYHLILSACREALGLSASGRAVALLAELVSFNRALPTGAPTSPLIANLVLRSFDLSVSTAAAKRQVTYTRYADDLTFSADDKQALDILPFVERLLAELGYELDERKTNIYRKGRRQEVTGLVVNHRPSVTRTYRRRLRAAVHALATGSQPLWHGRPMTHAQLMGHLGHLAQTQPEEASRLRQQLPSATT